MKNLKKIAMLIDADNTQLSKLEAVIQHNEAPLDTWTPLEHQLQLDYGGENAAEFPWLRALRDALRQDTLEKLGK